MTLLMDQDEARKHEVMRLEFSSRLDTSFDVTSLPCGDFASLGTPIHLGVERKSLPNFLGSIFADEMDEQMARMVDTYELPVLLIEGIPFPGADGRIELYGTGRRYPYGLLMSEMATWFARGAMILPVKGIKSTVQTVIGLYEYVAKPDHRDTYSPRRLMANMRPMSVRDRVLLQLDGLGPGRLKKVGSESIEDLVKWDEKTWQKTLGKVTGSKAYESLRQPSSN